MTNTNPDNIAPPINKPISAAEASRANYDCPHCPKELVGLAQYYLHVAYYHTPNRPITRGKKAGRAPTVGELREAMVKYTSIAEASRQMGVSTVYLVKWFKILVLDEWLEWKRNRIVRYVTNGAGLPLEKQPGYQEAVKILAGEKKAPRLWRISQQQKLVRLEKYGLLIGQCNLCGFHEPRASDYRCPLIVDFLDGDSFNWKLDNLNILCYNCYFLNVHDLMAAAKRKLMGYTKDKYY